MLVMPTPSKFGTTSDKRMCRPLRSPTRISPSLRLPTTITTYMGDVDWGTFPEWVAAIGAAGALLHVEVRVFSR